MPREIYIDFQYGNNANAGTSEAAPILNGVGWTPAQGDTLYLRNTLRPGRTDTRAQFAAKLLAWSSTLGIRIRQWGKHTWRISGAWQIAASEWSADTGTTWKATVGSVRIARCTYKYDDESRWVTLMDGITKMPAAFLELAPDVATCRTTTNSYFYDGASVLYVNLGQSSAPGENDIECVFGNTTASNTDNDLNAITAGTNASEADIDGTGGLIDRLGMNSDSDGYGIIAYGPSSLKVRNLLIREAGYHGAGCVGSGTKNVTFENVRSIGCAPTSTNFIFFSADTANVKGVKALDCLAGVVPPIKINGQLLSAVVGMNGAYHHTSPGASGSPRIEDVEWRGYTAVTYQPPGANHLDVMGMSCADTLSRPTVGSNEEALMSSYNVRCYNAVFIGCGIGAGVNSGYTSAIGFSRTLMVLGNYSSASPRAINYGYCGWAIDASSSALYPSTILVENSVHIFAFTSGGNAPTFYGAASENCQKRMVLRNLTIIADIEPSRSCNFFKAQFASPTANANTYRIENCLINKVQAGNVGAFFTAAAGDTYATLAASVYTVVDGNIIYLPSGTITWSDSTAIASTANFIANFGVRNLINVDPGMPNPRSSPAILTTGLAANMRHPLNPPAGTPFNGGEWDGPGAWNVNGKQLAGAGGVLELANMARQAM